MSMVAGSRCYGCFRPAAQCICGAIPRIENRTDVLILQHRRERFHRFNTARIVHRALRHSQLLIDRVPGIARRLELKPGAGLLYPSPAARLISEVPPEERPRQLVIVDGTWHQAKTLVRDIPALQRLPQYRLDPAAPSRFRIRREPHASALSTVEATVAALRVLEPETAGLDGLLAAFEAMVEAQLARFTPPADEAVAGTSGG
jgi:DTW domain-containing protein YfiP